jgi:hypothetical protein
VRPESNLFQTAKDCQQMEIVTWFGKIDQETGSTFGNKTEVKNETFIVPSTGL